MSVLILDLIVFCLSFILISLLVPIAIAIAIKIDFVDKPESHHKTHKEPVPYMGGVAIMTALSSIVFLGTLSTYKSQNLLGLAAAILIPSILLGIIGLVDDWKSLGTTQRLIIQSLTALISALIVISNQTIGVATGIFWIDILITTLWLVGICNAINFIDNHDGVAAGTVSLISLGIYLIAKDSAQELIASLALALLGTMLGFLRWNITPAKIYMGDAGSLFLGFLISVMTIRLKPTVGNEITSFAIPILLFMVPIIDTLTVVISRIRRKRSIFIGDRTHLSHRLMKYGFDKKETTLILWSLSGIFVGMAVAIAVLN